jgi:geranylgeranyl diphosphate synthase type I
MTMLDYFREPRQRISAYLKEQLEEKTRALGGVNDFGRDVVERLYRFALQGKMIRGGLVFLGFSVSRNGRDAGPGTEQLVRAAAAMELFQSALLVHDDIMDRDPLRRGQKTLHAQYAELGASAGAGDAGHLGEGLGICAGDVGYFLAFETLAGLGVDPSSYQRILQLCARELSFVGVAQMQDLYNGATPGAVKDEEILKLYLYKTGRYSFSLPLMVGGLLAGAAEKTLKQMEELGEHLGIVFQIRDDELGLFSDTQAIGKPAGSDVREGKKTIYYSHLLRSVPAADRRRLSEVYGNPASGPQELKYVQELTVRLGIREAVAATAGGLAEKARAVIGALPISRDQDRQALRELLDYARTRPY